MPTEACLVHLVHSEVLVDGLDGMVIIGQWSSRSTFGANKYSNVKQLSIGQRRGPNHKLSMFGDSVR